MGWEVVLGLPGFAICTVLLQLGYDKSLFRHWDKYATACSSGFTHLLSLCCDGRAPHEGNREMLKVGATPSPTKPVEPVDSAEYSRDSHDITTSLSPVGPRLLLGSYTAPTTSDHIEHLNRMGFSRESADQALRCTPSIPAVYP